MVRWIFRMLLIGVVGWLGYGVVDGYQRGYFSIPDMPEGSYLFSIKSGFRGIVLDAKVSEPSSPDTPKVWRQIAFANPERRYIALPFEVGPYVVDAWSTCTAPTDEELAYFEKTMPEETARKFALARIEAICMVEADGKKMLRGLLYSFPKL